jgi:integrase/recombinase XerD
MSKRKTAPKGCFWRGPNLWARAQVRGRDYKFNLRTDDPQVAKRRAKQWREQLVGSIHYGEHPRRTFASVLEAWGPWIARQVGPRTLTRYASSLGILEPFLDGKFLDEVDGRLIGDVIRARQAQHVTNATIRRDLVALSSVMGFAIDQGWIEANPVLPRMTRLKERRDPIVLPDQADVAKVIARAPGQFAKLIEAAWRTGARQEELAGAHRSQLSETRRELSIRGKGNKVRVIDLEPFGAFEIFRSLPVALGTVPLFWHMSATPLARPLRYANVASRFRALCREIADHDPEFRPFRFHDLRHLHAVEWLRSGRSIYALQQRLGHRSIKTTEQYLTYVTAEQAAVAKTG